MNRTPSAPTGPAEPVPEHEIRRSLEAVLASEAFVRSERMSRFLRHVVESALSGTVGQCKEQVIGHIVFDRPLDYDPKEDPVVRNEARRLRGKLEQLYENPPSAVTVRIEVPRGGYSPRFSLLPATVAPAAVPFPKFRWLPAYVAGFLVAAVCVIVYLRSGGDQDYVYAKLKPLTAEAASELHPSFDRSGRQIAYSGNALGNYDIFIRDATGQRVRITDHPAAEFHPSWSPDGARVAFSRVQGTGYDVIVKVLATREERPVAQLRNLIFGRPADDATQVFGNVGPVWAPGSDWLALTNGSSSTTEGRAIHLISAASGEDRRLTHPKGNEDDLDPAFSPDGGTLAYCRWQTSSSSNIFLVSTGGGPERQLTHERADFRGLAWMPNGKDLLASSNRSGLFGLWLISVRDGKMRPLTLSASNARDPAVAPDGKHIVYSEYRLQSEIREVELSSRQQRSLIQSNRENHSAQYSPDGNQIAFVSDRTGSWEIWTSGASGAGQRQITHFEGPMVGSVRWAPDGSKLAFDARPEGRAALHIISPEGSWPPQPFLSNTFEEKMPSWSRDGKWLYFNSTRGGLQQLWRVPLPRPAEATMMTREIVTDSHEGPGGEVLYFTNRDEGIWELNIAGGSPRLVPGLEKLRPRRLWTVNERGIWFVQTEFAPPEVWLYSFRDRAAKKMLTLPGPVSMDTPSLSLKPDCSKLLLSLQKEAQSQIMLLEVSRP